jgi:hypothetical protein
MPTTRAECVVAAPGEEFPAGVTRGGGSYAAEPHVRRLWLPWRPRFRLVFAYPRYWHWVLVGLERFDVWFTHRYRRRWFWWPLFAVVFLAFLAVRFLGLVAVFEITIIAFAASIYLAWGEWLALLLLFPFVVLARLAHLLPWRLSAHAGGRRWTARIAGWRTSRQTGSAAREAIAAGREPPGTVRVEVNRRSRFWI